MAIVTFVVKAFRLSVLGFKPSRSKWPFLVLGY